MGVGLREQGGILLVSTYELGHQPMGLAMPAAFLRRAGFNPACLDTSVGPLGEELLLRAQLVVISTPMHTALRLGVPVARRVRSVNPDATIILVGNYSWLNRKALLGNEADFVLAGESEQDLVDLARRLEARNRDGSGRGRLLNPAAKSLERLSFPVPDRTGLPGLTHYARLRTPTGECCAGYVEASRGCKYACTHCPIPPVYGGRLFVVPREVVLADIRNLYQNGARHITFGDPDFLNAPRHSLQLSQQLHEEFPTVTFDFTAKVEHLIRYSELLPGFARAGCVFIVTAAESLSDRVLRILRKGHSRRDIEHVVVSVREAGIVLRPSWVSFTPWTSLKDYLEVFTFAEARNLVDNIDPIQYTIRLLVPPGSSLADDPEMRPYLSGLDSERLSYRWRHPDPRMDLLQSEASRLVERAMARREDTRSLFMRLWESAGVLAEVHSSGRDTAPPLAVAATTYGLTEPWFC